MIERGPLPGERIRVWLERLSSNKAEKSGAHMHVMRLSCAVGLHSLAVQADLLRAESLPLWVLVLLFA